LTKKNLSKNIEFKKVFLKGKRIKAENLVIFILGNDYKYNRLGLIVKKEIGKAVVRNKIRRLLKEAFRNINKKIYQGYDIIILVKKNAIKLDYFDFCNKLENLLKYIKRKDILL